MTSAKQLNLWFWCVGLLVLCLQTTGCRDQQGGTESAALKKQQIQGPTMGTTYHITICTPPSDQIDAEQLKRDIDQLLVEINQQMSTYIKDSELSQFNQTGAEEWFTVSPEVVKVVSAGLKLSEDSDGAFDMTVGPLVNLWHFGPDPGKKTLPAKEKIEAARQKVGYQHIEVQPTPPALKKLIPEVYVDLSAIAKGYGVDAVGELLEKRAIENYLVEIGGEMRARGVNQQGQAWKVGIEKPVSESRVVQKIVPLSNLSMATSGNYRNFFEVDGVSYSHTIDPRTGRPAAHTLASVTVVGKTCMNCDAIATCLMVLGPEAGYNWVKERNIAAYFIVKTDAGFTEQFSPAWQEQISEGHES